MIKLNPFAEPQEKKFEIRGITVYYKEILDGEAGKTRIADFQLPPGEVDVFPKEPRVLQITYEDLLQSKG